MSITAAELICYCALNRPTDEVSTGGGGIADTGAALPNKGIRPTYVQFTATKEIGIISTSASDTANETTTGRDSTGAVVTETLTMIGVTEKDGTQQFQRIHDVTVAAAAIGTITFKQGTAGSTSATIPIGEQGISMLFKRSASGAGALTRYDKIFWKNTDASLTLTSATIAGITDATGLITQLGLAATKNDTLTIANRQTAPAGITFVGFATVQSCVGGQVEAVTSQGVWVKQALGANQGPNNTNFTTQMVGNTT